MKVFDSWARYWLSLRKDIGRFDASSMRIRELQDDQWRAASRRLLITGRQAGGLVVNFPRADKTERAMIADVLLNEPGQRDIGRLEAGHAMIRIVTTDRNWIYVP